MTIYVHYVPGRLRIKTPALKRAPAAAAAGQARLAALPGVTAVEVNPLTGSALIHFIDAGEPGRLWTVMRELGWVTGEWRMPERDDGMVDGAVERLVGAAMDHGARLVFATLIELALGRPAAQLIGALI